MVAILHTPHPSTAPSNQSTLSPFMFCSHSIKARLFLPILFLLLFDSVAKNFAKWPKAECWCPSPLRLIDPFKCIWVYLYVWWDFKDLTKFVIVCFWRLNVVAFKPFFAFFRKSRSCLNEIWKLKSIRFYGQTPTDNEATRSMMRWKKFRPYMAVFSFCFCLFIYFFNKWDLYGLLGSLSVRPSVCFK